MHGQIRAHVNTAAEVLRRLGVLEEHNEWVMYPPDLPSKVRQLSYLDEFRIYQNQRLYDLFLIDQSLFQFKDNSDTDVSYCYFPSPLDVPTYQNFVAEQLGQDYVNEHDIGDEFHDEYDLAIATATLKKAVTPIRYDYSPNTYEAGVHPAGHIHIGTGNEIRICATKRMLPTSFVMFVLRQIYPDEWRRLLGFTDAPVLCRAVRDQLDKVDAAYLQAIDYFQLVLE